MGVCLDIPQRRSIAYVLLLLFISTILFLNSNLRETLISSQTIQKHTDRNLEVKLDDVTARTSNRKAKKYQDRTYQPITIPPKTKNTTTKKSTETLTFNQSTGEHEEKLRFNDFMSGGALNFYNAMLGQKLSLSLYLNDLKSRPISLPQKEKEICMFMIENSSRRLDVAIGYACLLQLQMTDASSELDIFRAIKYGSLSLESFYKQTAAVNLLKAIISGYEVEVSFLGVSTDNITQFCTGYRNDEESFLEEMLWLNKSGLSERVMIRQSYIQTFGRSSFNENATQIDLEVAIDKLNCVRNTTKIKQNNILDIVLTVTEDYAIAAATCLVSALVNSNLDSFYRFHVVMDPERLITEESKRKLASYTYIRDYSIDFVIFPLELISNIVKEKIVRGRMFICMYRLYLDLIFPDLDSVLYLDTDVIVRRDLNALKSIDMTDYIWAGAPVTMYRYNQPYCNGQLPHHFINAGVLLINLTNSRRLAIHDKIINYLLYVDECSKHEQSLVNTVFSDYIYFLPHRWNAIVNTLTERFHFSSFIVHHIGGGKPWDEENAPDFENKFDDLPVFRQEWGRYQKLTSWW